MSFLIASLRSKNGIRVKDCKNIFTSLLVLIFFAGCALITDEYQANQRKVIAYLLEDVATRDPEYMELSEDARQLVKSCT